jgi:hypothetical protein
MSQIGRNDPCPCGSGRKYKKCCLSNYDSAAAARRADMAARESVIDQLLDYGYGGGFDDDREIGDQLFWTERVENLPDNEYADLLEDVDSQVKFNTWFLFDLEIEDGKSVADLFLDEHGHRLTPIERGFLERMRRSHLSLFEVESVEAGQGMTLLDLWGGTRVFVHERMGTEQVVTWDLIGARVVPDRNDELHLEGGVYLYPTTAKEALLRDLRRSHRRFMKDSPGSDDGAFFRRYGMVFNHWWLDHVVMPPIPRLVTNEGDDLVFTRTVFALRDEDALREALSARDDAELNSDGCVGWMEMQGESRHCLGTVRIAPGEVCLETMSKPRGDRGRRWLEEAAGRAIEYRSTSFETVDEALSGLADAAHEATIPPEVETEVLEESLHRHYREWLDTPLPALRNRSPRQAVKSASLRPRVVDLLKEMDNRAERDRRSGRPAFDSTELWTELRLARPNAESPMPWD